MTALFENVRFSVPAPGTDNYREQYEKTFGERPSGFCPGCDKRASWCECAVTVVETAESLVGHPDPDDLEDYRRY